MLEERILDDRGKVLASVMRPFFRWMFLHAWSFYSTQKYQRDVSAIFTMRRARRNSLGPNSHDCRRPVTWIRAKAHAHSRATFFLARREPAIPAQPSHVRLVHDCV